MTIISTSITITRVSFGGKVTQICDKHCNILRQLWRSFGKSECNILSCDIYILVITDATAPNGDWPDSDHSDELYISGLQYNGRYQYRCAQYNIDDDTCNTTRSITATIIPIY